MGFPQESHYFLGYLQVLAVHVKAVHKGETVFIQSSEQNKEVVSEPQIVNNK